MKLHARDIAYDKYRFAPEWSEQAQTDLARAFRGTGWTTDPGDAHWLRQSLDECWFAALEEADKVDITGLSDDEAYRVLYRTALPLAKSWNCPVDSPVVSRVAARALARDLVNHRNGTYTHVARPGDTDLNSSRAIIAETFEPGWRARLGHPSAE